MVYKHLGSVYSALYNAFRQISSTSYAKMPKHQYITIWMSQIDKKKNTEGLVSDVKSQFLGFGRGHGLDWMCVLRMVKSDDNFSNKRPVSNKPLIQNGEFICGQWTQFQHWRLWSRLIDRPTIWGCVSSPFRPRHSDTRTTLTCLNTDSLHQHYHEHHQS